MNPSLSVCKSSSELSESPVFQVLVLRSSMNREACRAAIHGVAKSRTRLNDWTELKGLNKMKLLAYTFVFQSTILVWWPKKGPKNRLLFFTWTPRGSLALVPEEVPLCLSSQSSRQFWVDFGSPVIDWWAWVLVGGIKSLAGVVVFPWNSVSRRDAWVKDTEKLLFSWKTLSYPQLRYTGKI